MKRTSGCSQWWWSSSGTVQDVSETLPLFADFGSIFTSAYRAAHGDTSLTKRTAKTSKDSTWAGGIVDQFDFQGDSDIKKSGARTKAKQV